MKSKQYQLFHSPQFVRFLQSFPKFFNYNCESKVPVKVKITDDKAARVKQVQIAGACSEFAADVIAPARF